MPQNLNDIPLGSSGGASYSTVVPSGTTIKLETNPGGVEIFTGTPPPGKKWLVQTNVFIEEVDE